MINIFLSSLIGSIIVIGNGYILNSFFFKKKINEFDIYKDSILGFIFIGFLSLVINFFFPINKSISSIFLAISIFAFVYFFFNVEKKKKFI